MKKIFVFLTVVGLALSFGLAYAGDDAAMVKDMNGALSNNGITYFGPAPSAKECVDTGGSGAGGITGAAPVLAGPYIFSRTLFDISTAGSTGRCAWSGISSKDLDVKNGVTVQGGSDM